MIASAEISILDVEDDFYTLRERGDYVIAGGDGADIPISIATAPKLALEALTHGFSLIVQMNDLGSAAPAYVAAFVDALMNSPRELWHPLLIVVDEAQRFAPSQGSTEASESIRDIVERGRKRGFTGLFASLAISSIDARVRGLCNNWLLGRTGSALDRDTSAKQLGFTRKQALEAMKLQPRHFWAYGPAIADEPVLFRVGDVETTPVRAGLLSDLTVAWSREHVAELEAPERYLDSLVVWDAFWENLAARKLLPEPLVVSAITNGLVDLFIEWRRAQGASPPTISRDIAALRGPINWAMKPEINRLTAGPRIKDVKGRKKMKELEWNPEQIAVILDAARALPERAHVHLYAMIMLSTHARSEATLELSSEQIRDGRIHFLRPGEDQTRKRRPIGVICPTLAPWLDGIKGKVIVYRTPISPKRWKDPDVPEFFERPTSDIGNAFANILIAAHELRPDLGFAHQDRDEAGKLLWLSPRAKLGEIARRPKMKAIGTPNTLRHTIHTWHKRQGVPDAQIDAAAGHSEEGTGANYTHLRPEYLREFVESTEAFWAAVGEFTDAHLLYQRSTNVASLASARVTR